MKNENGGNMRQLKKGISLSLDEDVIKELQGLAEEQDRSLSQAINMILREFIEKGQEAWMEKLD